MPTLENSARRLLIVGGFAVAVAAAPAIAALTFTPTTGPSIADCPNGESLDIYNGECSPDLVPNSPTLPQNAEVNNDGLPTVDGVPCGGRSSGQCIGLADENAAEGPAAVPRSAVDGAPLG